MTVSRGIRRPRWFAWLLALLLFALTPLAAHAEATVRDIRIAAHEGGARLVIDLSRRVDFHHVMLSAPPRLAIDLPEVAWLVPEAIGDQPVDLVRGFRFGRFRPGVSRLVVDLAAPFEIEDVFELPANGAHGHRIITDLVAAKNGAGNTSELRVAAAAGPPRRLGSALDGEPRTAAGTRQEHAALPVPLRRGPPLQKPERPDGKRTVVIDPGHGGIDPGAIGSGGTLEKDIVLAIGRELRRQLQATGRYEVVMTREGDDFVRLRDRLRIAREHQGDLFLSLHADSLVQAPQVRGAAVYTLSEQASNDEAAKLANKENRADILGGIDLSDQEEIVTQILIDLAQRDANNKSIRVAELLVEELDETTEMLRRRRQQAGFVVLKSPDMPSALLELGYLSNAQDERRLSDPEHLADLSEAIVRAVDRYFGAEAF